MMCRDVKCVFGSVFIVFLLVGSSPVGAYSQTKVKIVAPVESEGVVKLIATLQDSPAFTGVVWQLYRTDLSERLVMTIKRHTAIVNLQPGNYRAVARLKSIARSQRFNLESKDEKEIILSMDQ